MPGKSLVEDTGARLWTTAGKLVTHHDFSEELGERIRRPDGAKHAVAAMLAAFGLPCLSAPSAPITAVEPVTTPVEPSRLVTVSTGNLVEAMLRAGVCGFAKRPNSRRRGMKETEYGDLWPSEVTYPTGYDTAYPHLLLVDQTLQPDRLRVCCVDTNFFVDPASCRVLSGVPKFLVGPGGKRLKRAVIFWGYEANLDRKIEDCRPEATAVNIPMIHWHGPWIIVQHKDDILCRHAIDLLGSSFGVSRAPYVSRFDRALSYFDALRVEIPDPRWGSGFRGSELVPVP